MRHIKLLSLLLIIVLLGAGFWLYQRPLPAVQAEVIIPENNPGQAITLPWPDYGQAAIGTVGYGILAKTNTSTPVPIASIAKAITALSILEEKPLGVGLSGPIITITEQDVELYRDYLAKDGSVLPLNSGTQISQYQLLQAMMLPSANNIADTAAVWAFGSMSNYVEYANRFVKTLGMKKTTVDDASGFSAKTISTAEDLVLLGNAALQNPVLAAIVSQKEATFPVVGIAHNVNYLLGVDGIIGIKTGNTDEAGGCYLFGAKRSIAGREVRLIGAVLGAPNRDVAMAHSRVLIQAADQGFEEVTALKKNQIVGRYNLPWGGSADAVASGEVKTLSWRGKSVVTNIDLKSISGPKGQNDVVGSVNIQRYDSIQDANSAPVRLTQSIPAPPWTWRIFR